jgi:hypothetical protein
MYDDASLWTAPEPRHTQRIRDQVRFHVWLHRSAHHQPAEQVDDDRQINPAFSRRTVRDVTGGRANSDSGISGTTGARASDNAGKGTEDMTKRTRRAH